MEKGLGWGIIGLITFLLCWVLLFKEMYLIFVIIAVLCTVSTVKFFKFANEIEKRNKADKDTKLNDVIKSMGDFSVKHFFLSPDHNTYIGVDEINKTICIVENLLSHNIKHTSSGAIHDSNNYKYQGKAYKYSEILQSEIVEDGESITKTSRVSQIGGALIGGAVAGGIGAIVGGLSGTKKTTDSVRKITLQIIVDDISKPIRTITFLNKSYTLKKASVEYKEAYKKANHWHNLISVIIKKADEDGKMNNVGSQSHLTGSVADELTKLSQLKKEGILTEAEFDSQKQKLLG
jgi:hypothetical protein